MVKRIVKGILKILAGLFSALLLLLLMIWVQPIDPTNQDPKIRTFRFPDTLVASQIDMDSLLKTADSSQGLPVGFEKAGLIAYSAYPQLRNIKIDMVFRDYGPPMQANFNIWSLLGPAKNRHYIIHLNDARNTPFDAILLRNLPFNAQVGILAHELGHVSYYDQLNTLQIAKWGIKYLISDDFRSTHEKSTDLQPVYHGLGNQIWQYAWYVRYDDCCQVMYETYKWIDRYYLTDKEIWEAMNTHSLYQDE